jgi:hypothetical protein
LRGLPPLTELELEPEEQETQDDVEKAESE